MTPKKLDDEASAALAAALNAVHLGSAFDDPDDEMPIDPTQILDARQQQDLMSLRAQQSNKLRGVDKRIVVMFTDLVGSTQYYERYGDWKGREKVLTHNALLFPIIQSTGGVIVKTIGDAIMAYFGVASDALRASATMQQALASYNRDIGSDDHQIHIRVALNAGLAITQQGDIYGDVVNVAARIEHSAKADEVLMGGSVLEAAGKSWPIESAGSATFKGKAEPIPLFRLRWKEMAISDPKQNARDLPERFAVTEQLAKGSAGELYLAEDRRTKLVVVVKKLYDFLAKDSESRLAFVGAARDMAKLQHEGIVRVLDHSRPDQQPAYYAAELIDGQSLGHLVTKNGPPTFRDAAAIVARVAQIVAVAHAGGVLHRSVDPDSVLIRRDGRLVLTNFGMSVLTAIQIARGNSPPGSPAYTAPEQLLGKEVGERCDVYSLGALLYYLVSGREPVENAETLQGTIVAASGAHVPLLSVAPAAPPQLVAIVDRALALAPQARHANVSSLFTALRDFVVAQGGADPSGYLRGDRPPADRGAAKASIQPVATPPPLAPKSEPPIKTDIVRRAAPPQSPWTQRVLGASAALAAFVFALGLVVGRATAPAVEKTTATLPASLPTVRPPALPPPASLPSPGALTETLENRALIQKGDAFTVLRNGNLLIGWTAQAKPVALDLKQLTSVVAGYALLRAIDTGKLRGLDQPVYELFPEWKQGKKQAITLRHILEHSTGLQADDTPLAQQDVLRLALAADVVDPPGTRYVFNQKALGLIGGVIQRATGKRLDVYVQEALLAPLGIVDTSWNLDAAGQPLSHSGLKLGATDFAKLVNVFFRDGSKLALQGNRLNPEVSLLWAQVVPPATLLRDPWTRKPALQTDVRGFFALDDSGTWVLVLPEEKLVFVRQSKLPDAAGDMNAVLAAAREAKTTVPIPKLVPITPASRPASAPNP